MIEPKIDAMTPDEKIAFLEKCLLGNVRLLIHYKDQMDISESKIHHMEHVIKNKQESLDRALGKDGKHDWCEMFHQELRINEELKKQIPKSRLKVEVDYDIADSMYKVFLRKDGSSEPYILSEAARRPEVIKFCVDHGFEVVA